MAIKTLMPVKSQVSGSLKPSTASLAARQTVNDLTSIDRGNDAVTTPDPGKVLGFLPIPRKITVTVLNGAAVANDICFLNNADFTALPANVTVTYSDGFSGKLLTRLMNGLDSANGLLIYGFNVTGYDNANAKSDAVLNDLSMQIRYYNGYGDSYIPAALDLAGDERNTQFKDGLLTVKQLIQLNFVTQIKVHLGAGEKAQFVFFTQPMKD